MVNENAGAEPEPSTDRHELERLAFGRPRTDADAAAAESALRQLVDADREHAASAAPTEPPFEAGVDQTDASTEPETAEPRTGSLRRFLPLVVVVGLLVGLGAGVAIGRASLAPTATEPSDTETFTAVVPGAVGRGDNAAAAAKLATDQTSADVFPIPSFAVSLGLEPKTVHLILTEPDGNSLWIGRTSAAICLLFSDPQAVLTNDDLDPSIASAGSSCATAEAFESSGLTVRNGSDSWSWNGSTFSQTPAG
jgi:hypothetical protein